MNNIEGMKQANELLSPAAADALSLLHTHTLEDFLPPAFFDVSDNECSYFDDVLL